jgi:hypothetical protein
MDNQFKTTCPHCGEGGELFVTKVTLIQSGNVLPMYVPLQGDGFVFDPNDINIRDWSTTDEEVTCRACGTKMPLSELTN